MSILGRFNNLFFEVWPTSCVSAALWCLYKGEDAEFDLRTLPQVIVSARVTGIDLPKGGLVEGDSRNVRATNHLRLKC